MIKKPFIALILFSLLTSCSSNTIFEEPKDLIPKDSMVLLLKDLVLATTAKGFRNFKQINRFNYVHLVYEKYKIDSLRFKQSNFYYISKVDVYEPMLNEVISLLEDEESKFKEIKRVKDSIKNDSIEQIHFLNTDNLKKRDKVDFLKRKKISTKSVLKKKLPQ